MIKVNKAITQFIKSYNTNIYIGRSYRMLGDYDCIYRLIEINDKTVTYTAKYLSKDETKIRFAQRNIFFGIKMEEIK